MNDLASLLEVRDWKVNVTLILFVFSCLVVKLCVPGSVNRLSKDWDLRLGIQDLESMISN